MKALAGVILLSSFSVFASNIDKTLDILKSERKCLSGGERSRVEVNTERPKVGGQHYFGVTSSGDIAVIQDNSKIILHLCKRDEPIKMGNILKDIKVTKPGKSNCSVQQILKMDVVGDNSTSLHFRWLESDETSLCNKQAEHGVEVVADECNESKGSIMQLSEDVIKANSEASLKKLKKWYKKKVGKETAYAAAGEFRFTAEYPFQCGETKKVLGFIEYTQSRGIEDCKGFQAINRESVPLKEGDRKSDNKFLAQVFSKKDGKIVRVEHVAQPQAYGNREVFIVHKELKNGDKVKYKIDPNINPAFNPIEVVNVTQKKIESSQLYYMGYGMNASFGNGFYGW